MEFGCVFIINSILLLVSYSDSHEIKIKDFSNLGSEIYLDSMQLISKSNYPVEKHLVTTEDGYVLTLFRIPGRGPPVLLVHGIGDSSDSWLVLGPNKSLAYRLADDQFDVWLFNSRGNKYSKKHINKISQKKYWDFSFEEMGSKDLPATIDYILSKTSQSKLSYVGFSQGTTIFFVLCSMRPSYNDKIKQAILLAPVATINNIQTPLISLYANIYDKLTLLAEAGVNEVFPSNVLVSTYHAKVCNLRSPLRFFCGLEYYINFGLKELERLPDARLPIITSHIPAGGSAKTFLHFLQGYVFKSFRRYNYGVKNNLKVYNSTLPPVYDLSAISAPVTLVISESDWISTIKDAKLIQDNLKNIVRNMVINKTVDFSHLEFVYGERVSSVINDPILRFMKS
ncbi:PREDICTED: lipase 3-like [Papilio polytes]|uniref:lipase 3-like n=1 Tax=Papilio polytes TaxID=76194 RepID=UPI0006764502|nr:PREDICTED: lipase 3-like [Papilio polytes]